MVEKATSLEPDCTMGMLPTISGGGPIWSWWCPETMASTLPCSCSATRWIPCSPWLAPPSSPRLPMCAVTRTMVQPCARSSSASFAAIGPPSRNSYSSMLAGLVVSGVSTVESPMMPTLVPAACTMAVALAQSGRVSVPFKKMLAARIG